MVGSEVEWLEIRHVFVGIVLLGYSKSIYKFSEMAALGSALQPCRFPHRVFDALPTPCVGRLTQALVSAALHSCECPVRYGISCALLLIVWATIK